jgi:hypothetical protein
MTYGYDVQGHDDKKVDAARRASRMGAVTALPSDLLVNGLPFRLHFLSCIVIDHS